MINALSTPKVYNRRHGIIDDVQNLHWCHGPKLSGVGLLKSAE